MSERLTFDESQPGIKIVTFSGPLSAEEFDAYVLYLELHIAALQPSCLLIEATGSAATLDGMQRRRLGQFLRRYDRQAAVVTPGVAFVFESALHRMVLGTMLLVGSAPWPYTVVAKRAEALQWCRARLLGRVPEVEATVVSQLATARAPVR